jgi:hypothetical protein
MFTWSKTSGGPARFRFYWWPLLISIALSVIVTILIND